MVLAPQSTKNKDGSGWWNPSDLTLLLDHVIKTQQVDEKRIYLTGLSMGASAPGRGGRKKRSASPRWLPSAEAATLALVAADIVESLEASLE